MSMLGRQSPDERDERLGGSRMATTARKEENIYIPQFITKRPFYAIDESEEDAAAGGAGTAVMRVGGESASTGGASSGRRDYLEHQRLREKAQDTAWYQRGKTAGPAATKYRKGACENCGSMGHKKRDCLSRPRAKLAKYTGADIAPDEVVQDVRLGWDAKRDRWLGFDARDYATMVAQKQKLEALRGAVAGGAGGAGDGAGEKPEADKNDTRYAEDADMGVSRTNGAADLRMREDTASYLVNLDLDSAQYDPKRRKIVAGGAFLDDSARLFAEQNFARASGEAAELAQAERYAWEVHDQTGDASMHLQANPTAAAQRRKEEAAEEAQRRAAMAALMRERYGVEPDEAEAAAQPAKTAAGTALVPLPTADAPNPKPKPKPIATSEAFVEYDASGHVKEKPHRADRSKYPEDVLTQNHTAVWGSWWHNFTWGYACCHSSVRNSYCTGAEGRAAFERAERQRLGDWGDDGEPEQKLLTA